MKWRRKLRSFHQRYRHLLKWRIVRKRSLLLAIISLLFLGATVTSLAEPDPTPKIFVNPPSITGDLTPAPNSTFSVNIDVSDIPNPGLWGYEFSLTANTTVFPPSVPLSNMNFSSTTKWSTTYSGSGTPTYGYDSGDGNPSGSGSPSYYQRASSTPSATASLTFTTEQSFPWNLANPLCYVLSYAYKISGNSIASGSKYTVRVVKPDSTYKNLNTTSFTATKPWTYNVTEMTAIAFDQIGTYKFQLITELKTAAAGASNYVQVSWDDVGLKIAPVSATEGSFLTESGGDTFFRAKYFWTDYVRVWGSVLGTPYSQSGTHPHPVPGSGTLATVKFLVDYGRTSLHLYDTKLETLELTPPEYPHVPITHTSSDGFFCNKFYGDVDGDRDVDKSDLSNLSNAYGSDRTKPNWNLLCDFNFDGKVDVSDLFGLGKNYNKKV